MSEYVLMIIVKAWSIWLGRKRANNVLPEMNDNKGTSLSLAKLDKGRKVFADISERLIFREADLNKAIQYNPSRLTSVLTSVKKPAKRDVFMAKMRTQPIDKAMKHALPKSFPPCRLFVRAIRKLGRIWKG